MNISKPNEIKVLPLDFWMKRNKKSFLECVKSKNKINPVFNRHGYYYNRITKECWIECEFGCYLYDEKSFISELKLFNHNPLLQKEVDALKTLCLNKQLKKQFSEVLFMDNAWKEIRRVGRNSRKLCLSMLSR